MMLGESVVVGVGVGGGGGPLLRPRSADNLARLAPASSIPALDDLTESEVFVGEEDDDNFAPNNGVQKYEEFHIRPDSLQQIPPYEHVVSCEGTTPDLHSPTSPTAVPTTSLVITYHDEGLRLPLDAVKEEVEAEALEEASMILSSGPGSLSHTSLTSSVISNTSLDDTTLSSRTDTLDTVIAVPISRQSSSPESTHCSPTPAKATPARPSNRDAARVSGAGTRTSPTSPRGSSGRSSPRTSADTPRTPERRRKAVSVSSPRSDGSRGSTPRAPAMRTTPRTSEKPKTEEKKTPRSTLRSSTISTERKTASRLHDPIKRDNEKSSHPRTKSSDKDHALDGRCAIMLGCKKKTDTKDKTEADKCGTLGRKKKEAKSEKEEVAEKYGTLGRRRKAKESGDAKDDGKEGGMSKDTKHTLDMYATLPRRKAREISARWREQLSSEEEAAKSSLRRTKSIGKTESSSSSSGSRGRSINVMTSSLPSAALSGLSRARSPRSSHRDTRPSTSAATTRKERTIICLETAVQTSITGSDVSSAMRALSRQNSAAPEEDAVDSKPHVTFISEVPPPKEHKDRHHVEVQVELAWRLGDGELPEHVRRLTEEHTRLQTEHARARARLEETERLQSEIESLRKSLEEERSEKEEVQAELDRTSQRVMDMLTSMEGVEHEFNSRGDSLIELESQLHHSANVHIQMQEKLNQYEEFTLKIKRDLDKSVAAQKTLLQQVQDLENEGREISEFMAEEKNALAECLREAETELARLRDECKQLSAKYKQKDEEARHMVRLAEERKNKCMALQAEICSIQTRTRDMMVCQGAEVSGAAVSLANLSSRLHTLIGKLVQDYSITDSDLEMIVTPHESDSSASSTNGTPERKSPYKVSARTPSPRKTASFISALLHAMRGGPKEKMNQLGGTTHCNGTSKQITEGRNSPEGSESHDLELEGGSSNNLGSPGSSSNSVSLADQVTEVDVLLTRFLKVCCVLKNDTDNRLAEIEDENDRLCSQIRSQQVIIDQQHSDYENLNRSEARAKRELMAVSRDLDVASQKLNKYYQADYELQVKKLEDEIERLGTTVRHLEALHAEKEKQLASTLASLSAAQGPAPPNHVSQAVYQQEMATLNDKVASLRQSVIERDRRISELSERHSEDLTSIREAQIEAQKNNRRLTTTVDHVLKTLESVPDIVSGCPTLKQLFNTLAATEKSTLQQQQNGNAINKNVNNKDLNANPQTIINTGIINMKLSPTHKAETHL